MKNLQTTVEKFCTDNNLQCDAVSRLLDLHSELGELSKEVLKITNYGKNQILPKNKDLELEMGDALFSLICLANTLDINLESALEDALIKYTNRIRAKEAASSYKLN